MACRQTFLARFRRCFAFDKFPFAVSTFNAKKENLSLLFRDIEVALWIITLEVIFAIMRFSLDGKPNREKSQLNFVEG